MFTESFIQGLEHSEYSWSLSLLTAMGNILNPNSILISSDRALLLLHYFFPLDCKQSLISSPSPFLSLYFKLPERKKKKHKKKL